MRRNRKIGHAESEADDELIATVTLIQALQSEGKLAEAKREVASAQPLVAKSQNTLVRLQFEIASARLVLVSDHPESSRALLMQALKQTRAHGFVGMEYETRLSLAELDKKSGHGAEAKTALNSLAAAARRKRYGLIARKASAALR